MKTAGFLGYQTSLINPLATGLATRRPRGRRALVGSTSLIALSFAALLISAKPVFALHDGGGGSSESGTLPSSPGATVFSPDGQLAYVTYADDDGSGGLAVINTTTKKIAGNISLPQSSFPSTVNISPDGSQVYVDYSNPDGADIEVAVIDTQSGSIIATISGANNIIPHNTGLPFAMTLSPDGKTLYVGNSAGYISVMDIVHDTLTATIPVSKKNGIYGMAFSNDGQNVYAIAGQKLYEISAADNQITKIINIPATPVDLEITPDGKTLYMPLQNISPKMSTINQTGVLAIDSGLTTQVAFIPGGKGQFSDMAISPDGQTGYVIDSARQQISVIDLKTNQITGNILTEEPGGPIAISPNGRWLYAGQDFSVGATESSLAVIDTTTNAVVASIPTPTITVSDSSTT